MAVIAYDKEGRAVVATGIAPDAWDALKSSYAVGDLTMHCCQSPAIPKTSINGVQFFAHYIDECTSAPETVWHLEAKELVAFNLAAMGITCDREKDGRPHGWNWIADIYFTVDGRRIVVELQHSPQTLKEYQRRQARYRQCGVECYWLLYNPRFDTICNAMSKWRIKHEFGGTFPETGWFPFIQDIPIALLDTELGNIVRGAAGMHITVSEFLSSITEERLKWRDGVWFVIPRNA
jgi:competence protein CoiA